MRILISNDDGVYAPGIQALQRAFAKLGETWVVAPLEEKSTTGHSLTLHKPLRVLNLERELGKRYFGVSGSPADCIYLATRHLLRAKPDLVVSGINRGANLGQDIYYSGTVSAAREAAMLEIPALAVSLVINFKRQQKRGQDFHYATAARYAVELARRWKTLAVPNHTLLNLNVPDAPYAKVRGLKSGHQGFRYYEGTVLKRRDHRGRDYYWVGGMYQGHDRRDETDCDWVERGYAAVTPIKIDATDTLCLARLQERIAAKPGGRR
ncbi:MAG: 5'/3'-nucleotidase SurE [Bacteriovoracia bacterium]